MNGGIGEYDHKWLVLAALFMLFFNYVSSLPTKC